jgi:hypothetical protein
MKCLVSVEHKISVWLNAIGMSRLDVLDRWGVISGEMRFQATLLSSNIFSPDITPHRSSTSSLDIPIAFTGS